MIDIGWNDIINNHTINIMLPLVQITPLDVIIDLSPVFYAAPFVIVFIYNFIKGYRGEE